MKDRVLKPALFVACAAPMAWLSYAAYAGKLGADPVAKALNELGWWALFMLMASLAMTPLQLVFGWSWPIRIRRMLGLYAFAYATLHLCTYAGIDQGLAWGDIWKDIAKRQFITVGFCAWLILLPLAATSTNGWVKRLGFGRWKQIHRLTYVAATCGVVHFIWRVKRDETVPYRFAFALVGLLGIRVAFALLARMRASSRALA